MSFYRALSRQLIKNYVAQRAVVPWYQQEQKLTLLEEWVKDKVYPVWFKYVKGPYERYQYEHAVAELRGYGLMFDDQHNVNEPVVERAVELLPHDLAVSRYRRMMRAFEMNTKKTHLPVEEQNYDPMVPYLAPFIEEAKFQMQEEQELLNFHPWDRRLYSGPTTGLGETTPYSTFSCWCAEEGWEFTVLAQDGSLLEDVLIRQIPHIPASATHVVLSASGNNLLALLNQMVRARFTVSSMYGALWEGMRRVADLYRELISSLCDLGCHVAVCTVYRPNFNHMFFKSLATVSLGMHNARLTGISEEFDCSVIDLANLLDGPEDFANPLELNTRGGAKVVENVTKFVADHPVMAMQRHRRNARLVDACDDDWLQAPVGLFGAHCCATRTSMRKVYASKEVPLELHQPDKQLASFGMLLGRPLEFSEQQQCWREV